MHEHGEQRRQHDAQHSFGEHIQDEHVFEREDGQHIQDDENMDGDSVDEHGLEDVHAHNVDKQQGLVHVLLGGQ